MGFLKGEGKKKNYTGRQLLVEDSQGERRGKEKNMDAEKKTALLAFLTSKSK